MAGKGGGAKGVRDRIFQDYREKYGVDATEDELRVEMRKEMKVKRQLTLSLVQANFAAHFHRRIP